MLSRPMLLVLGATLILTGYTFWQDHENDKQSEPALQTSARSAPIGRLASAAAARASGAGTASQPASSASAAIALADLFPKQSWAPPPPPPTKPPAHPSPTPVPVAPPLPMTITATWHDHGIDYFVIDSQGQSLVLCNRCDTPGRIRPGETLLGVYRLNTLSRDVLTFTYLPLNQQQSLPTGGTP